MLINLIKQEKDD